MNIGTIEQLEECFKAKAKARGRILQDDVLRAMIRDYIKKINHARMQANDLPQL
jgi:hypothetical protein